MEYTIERLMAAFRNQLQLTSTAMVRSAMQDIDWQARLVGIRGARGVGKTTLILQYIKLHLRKQLKQTLYVSLDSLWFAEHSLLDLAEQFAQRGGRYLFLDEVHKYPNWSQEIKNCYDQFPQLKIVFTGSSLLEILHGRADLSRRAVVHELPGLSFREYLQLETAMPLESYPLKDVLLRHEEITAAVLEKLKPFRYWSSYLKNGYYPFHRERDQAYFRKIQEVINVGLELELPQLRGVDTAYVPRLKQLLFIIAQGVPFVPNVSKLSAKIGLQRSTLLRYLHYLEEVKLTQNIFKEAHGISKLQKPQKVYLENTNLMYALAEEEVNAGSVRETFFANQLQYHHKLHYPGEGDFLVDGTYNFEIGGKGKKTRQIKKAARGYIAVDDLEYGFAEKIPLWLFGFLY